MGNLLVCGGGVVKRVVSHLDFVVEGDRTLGSGLPQEVVPDNDQRDPRTPHVLLGARKNHSELKRDNPPH